MHINVPHTLFSIIISINCDVDDISLPLTSCINQSYENIEIIVVHYGKSDSHLEIEDERIKMYHLPNSSVSKARNYGLKKATGEVVTFVEAHQEIHESWLQKAAERLHVSQADAVQCGTMYIRDDKAEKLGIANDSIFGFYQRLLMNNTIPINSLVVKKDICALFPEEKKEIGEWEFWINTLRRKKVDVQGEYLMSFIYLTKPLDAEKSAEYEKERLEIMETYFKEISFSLKKLKQYMAIRKLKKKLQTVGS